MTQEQLEQFVTSLERVEREESMGYMFFFVGQPHYVPFVSIAYADNEHDRVSQLDREGVFRVNIGVSKETFTSLFPEATSDSPVDYTALDTFTPHPEYAKQFYICILNPSEKQEGRVKELIQEAHALALQKQEKKNP